MKNIFSKLFGRSSHSASLSKHDVPITIQDESDNATRHQLVQMLMRGIIRKHGIPAHWLELQILVVPGKKQGLAMHVRLVVKHWDVRLMNYAQAFQDQLLADIERYEPKCSEWLHGMSWQLEMRDCPYIALPDKTFWVTPTAAPMSTLATMAAAAPAPVQRRSDKHASLEHLFSQRDQQASDNLLPPSFEDTQPGETEPSAPTAPPAARAMKTDDSKQPFDL